MLFSRLLLLMILPFVNQAHTTLINPSPCVISDSLTARSSTSIGIIFDNRLNWAVVSATPACQAQILSKMPVIIANTVGISTGNVQSTSLGPQGTSTVFHALIPRAVANALKLQIALLILAPSIPVLCGPPSTYALWRVDICGTYVR
ncbi:hypothetical protein C8J57DRAFT_1397681, partial [Mycena rebaudengoi]